MKKILILITLLISVFVSVNAQSLDDLRQKAYEAAIEAVNKGKNEESDYEEYLERQELEAAEKAEEERKAEEVEVDKNSDKESELRNVLAYTVFNNSLIIILNIYIIYKRGKNYEQN